MGASGRPLVVELALQRLMARPSKVRRFNINECAPGTLPSLRSPELRLSQSGTGQNAALLGNQLESFGRRPGLLRRSLLDIESGIIMQGCACWNCAGPNSRE